MAGPQGPASRSYVVLEYILIPKYINFYGKMAGSNAGCRLVFRGRQSVETALFREGMDRVADFKHGIKL